jgi:hypothetical protein
MSQQYDNTNSGILAKNERKEKETHPDLSGSINVDGREYWLSAWRKTGKSGKLEGKTFFSLSVKPKDDQGTRNAPTSAPKQADDFADDDIPF